MAICLVCDLPYMARKEIEETVHNGMPVEEVERWVGLRFRLKIAATVLREHRDKCQKNVTWMRKLLEGAPTEPSVLVYFGKETTRTRDSYETLE